MINIRKRVLLGVPVVAAAAAALAVVISSLPASSASTALAPRMSAVDLANGLLFNQGRAAPYLGALNRPSIPLSGKLLAVERSVDRALRTHPALAAAFARDVQSGNRVKVDAALGSLSRITELSFDHAYGAAATRRIAQRAVRELNNPAQMAPDGSSGGGGSYVYAAVAVVIAAVAVLVLFITPASTPGGSRMSLEAARIANLVAVSLRAGK